MHGAPAPRRIAGPRQPGKPIDRGSQSRDVNRLLSMMIVDYGSGIRVAAPTSVLASMIHAARRGILIKGGSQLEKLNRVDAILFDKTGTLTEGKPKVAAET